MISRKELKNKFLAYIKLNEKLIGVTTGSGSTALYTVMGGADFIIAMSAGKFRNMGRSSLASYLCYSNSNNLVMDFGKRELLSIMSNTPIFFGLNATDPNIHLYEYIFNIKASGFSGLNNFPTVGLIDGKFRESLEEEGVSFSKEIEAIKIANFLDFFTVAFVFDEDQAVKMTKVGADVICCHLGLTEGGLLGAKKVLSIENARIQANKIFKACDSIRNDVIKMVYGGPINAPVDTEYIYDNTDCMGYIGGSAFERIPMEKSIVETTKSFKHIKNKTENDALNMLKNHEKRADYITFVREYIKKNYMHNITLRDIALITHVSSSHLSTKFKKEVGSSFTEYLIRLRLSKASDIIINNYISFSKIAKMVGYSDYAQFCKMFKKYYLITPTNFRKQYKKTSKHNIKL